MSGINLGSRSVDLDATLDDLLSHKVDVRAVERLHMEVALLSGVWTTAVMTLLKSPAGADWYPAGKDIEAVGLISDIDVHDARYVNIQLSTLEGAAGVAVIYFYGDGMDTVQTVPVPVFDTAGLATRLDDSAAPITYVGKAQPGTATSVAAWQVFRMTDTGSGLTIEYADGDDEFDNIWDSRAGLSYS